MKSPLRIVDVMPGGRQLLALSERARTASWLRGCASVGTGVLAHGRPRLTGSGEVHIADDVILTSEPSPLTLDVAHEGRLTLGRGSHVGSGAALRVSSAIALGANVVVGPDAVLDDAPTALADGTRGLGLRIDDGVLVGARSRVRGPIHVGAGAIILPDSDVLGDVEPGSVVGGSPARPLERATPVTSAAAPSAVRAVAAPAAAAPVDSERAAPVQLSWRGTLLADFTIDALAACLAQVEPHVTIDAEVAPFGQVVQTLHGLSRAEHKRDFALVWTRPEATLPSFAKKLEGGDVPLAELEAEVDAFAGLVRSHASAARFVFVASWTLPPYFRGTGMLELSAGGTTATLLALNLRLARALDGLGNVFVLDAARWVAMAGAEAYDPKLWFLAKMPFASAVFDEAARDVCAALRGLSGQAKKLLVLDLDETLWGGVVGDVGWENLRLGGHDAVGEALVQFQRDVLAIARRGVALAVVSKNEASVALEAMAQHPEMLIRPDRLAAYRINWRDKAQNIVEIARELNLGLQSVVFIDDNPVERGRVREALPEVLVPEWPEDQTTYARALQGLRCFDLPRLTDEDARRGEMYATERERSALKDQFASLDEWLSTLSVRVRFERLTAQNLARTVQLLNKTNQMNLRTRRLSEPELLAWASAPGHELWAVLVADRYGDSGLTGILGLRAEGGVTHVEDYVLSCRVMGRRVEDTLVWAATQRARALGAPQLSAEPRVTAKNKPCLDFFAQAGLERRADAWCWSGEAPYPQPRHIAIEGLPPNDDAPAPAHDIHREVVARA